jgi:hypothetical protein
MSTRLRPGRRDWLGRTPGNNCRKRSKGAERSRKKQEEVERGRKKQKEAERSREKQRERKKGYEMHSTVNYQRVHRPYFLRMSSVCPPYFLRMSSVCPPYVLRMSSVLPPHFLRTSSSSVLCPPYFYSFLRRLRRLSYLPNVSRPSKRHMSVKRPQLWPPHTNMLRSTTIAVWLYRGVGRWGWSPPLFPLFWLFWLVVSWVHRYLAWQGRSVNCSSQLTRVPCFRFSVRSSTCNVQSPAA